MAGAYVRISEADEVDDTEARQLDTAGIDRQTADCRQLAERHGWTITRVYPENDTSAFHRRVYTVTRRDRRGNVHESTELRVDRPAFRQLLDDLRAGVIQAVVAYDLDRVARDPRDLEDLIDVVEQYERPARAVTGSMDLSTDAGVTMARIMVNIANKSSRDTGRRVSRKHLELAESGKFSGGGLRPYGYAKDGMTVVGAEAAVIREMARRLIDGESLSAVAGDLRDRSVPTVTGRDWNNNSVRSVVRKARNAGLREYKGEVVGAAVWPAILTVDEWTQVKTALARRAQYPSGNRLVAWLTGVLQCHCGVFLTYGQHRGKRRYWCDPRHGGCFAAIIAEPTEQFVGDAILAFLAKPGVLALMVDVTSHDHAAQARARAAEDEAELKELAALRGARTISTAEWLAARRPIEERLNQARTIMQAATPGGVRKLLDTANMADAWAVLSATEKRDIARAVYPHGIRVLRSQPGFKRFDPGRLKPIDEASD